VRKLLAKEAAAAGATLTAPLRRGGSVATTAPPPGLRWRRGSDGCRGWRWPVPRHAGIVRLTVPFCCGCSRRGSLSAGRASGASVRQQAVGAVRAAGAVAEECLCVDDAGAALARPVAVDRSHKHWRPRLADRKRICAAADDELTFGPACCECCAIVAGRFACERSALKAGTGGVVRNPAAPPKTASACCHCARRRGAWVAAVVAALVDRLRLGRIGHRERTRTTRAVVGEGTADVAPRSISRWNESEERPLGQPEIAPGREGTECKAPARGVRRSRNESHDGIGIRSIYRRIRYFVCAPANQARYRSRRLPRLLARCRCV